MMNDDFIQEEGGIRLQQSRLVPFTIFQEQATSALAGFNACLLSGWLNWNLKMLVFVKGGKPDNPE